MELSEVVKNRRSVKVYEPGRDISDAELKSLFEEVTLAPSSFNLQHWMFIAVRDPAVKSQLKQAAWGQQQVEDCSVVFVACGKPGAYQDAPEIYSEAPQEIQNKVLPMIQNFYGENAQLQRDEAIRSASLASMTLMYLATSRGWDTCPMIGFDRHFRTGCASSGFLVFPVMMIALGYRKEDPRPRPYRRPVSEIVRFNSIEGPGLGV